MLIRQDQQQVVSQRIDPKLIMANTILQQTALELAQQIETELLENPALEVVEDDLPCAATCIDPHNCPVCPRRQEHLRSALKPSNIDPDSDSEHDFIPDHAYETDDDYDPVGNLEAELTLKEHLNALLGTVVADEDIKLGEYIINCLDDNGWLDSKIEEIAMETGECMEHIFSVLRIIQTFDPPGVGARDLRECMLLQLKYLREEGQANPLAETMISSHFDDMVTRRFPRLARSMGISIDETKQVIEFIKTHLTPYPAGQYRTPWAYKPLNNRTAIRPDAIIRRNEVGYDVEILGGDTFILGVNPTYRQTYDDIRQGKIRVEEEDRKHVTAYVERAELFIKNLNQRRKTLRIITKSIIDLQQGFLETGSQGYLRPLTRTRLAAILGVHESTVSRATAKKFVQLPNQEVVPFEMFFNPSLAARSAVEEMIRNEDPSKPLSDRQIVDLLRKRGHEVSRRTVVKYRDSQKLLSSNRRRR